MNIYETLFESKSNMTRNRVKPVLLYNKLLKYLELARHVLLE